MSDMDVTTWRIVCPKCGRVTLAGHRDAGRVLVVHDGGPRCMSVDEHAEWRGARVLTAQEHAAQYGACVVCGAPRDVYILVNLDGSRELRLFCTATATDPYSGVFGHEQ